MECLCTCSRVTNVNLSVRVSIGTGIVIDVQWCSCWQRHRSTVAAVLVASPKCGGIGANGVIDARRRSVELSGTIGSGDFNVKPGQVPLFVYYRVAVLFSKWYISNRAAVIV